MSHLQLSGISDLDQVERAQMESNGQISVIRKDRGETGATDMVAR